MNRKDDVSLSCGSGKYSAPRPDLQEFILATSKTLDVILDSQKPVVVLVEKTLTEGLVRDGFSEPSPLEEGGEGIRECDTRESQHEFDTVAQARLFAQEQRDPDKCPVETKIFKFREGKWELIEHRWGFA